jgi:hypothetical protein
MPRALPRMPEAARRSSNRTGVYCSIRGTRVCTLAGRATLLWLERRRPLRHSVESKVRREGIVAEDVNSNWSSGLTIWDWLHGTPRLNVPQEIIRIGVPGYQDPAQVTLPKVILMPLEKQWPERPLLTEEREPARSTLPVPRQHLLA